MVVNGGGVLLKERKMNNETFPQSLQSGAGDWDRDLGWITLMVSQIAAGPRLVALLATHQLIDWLLLPAPHLQDPNRDRLRCNAGSAWARVDEQQNASRPTITSETW
jgi:hypothetical protein